MNIFGSFEIGKKSLYAAQTGQSTTGHNIANVNTEGYSRQDVLQSASRPTDLGEGTGVDVNGIRRIQDIFTKKKVVEEQANVGTWEAKAETMARTEIIYTDLEGNGLRAALDEFWGAWGQVANEPEKSVFRKALLSKSEQLCERFQTVDNKLKVLRKDIDAKVAIEMSEINTYAKQLAKLNRQIQDIERKDVKANDLRDQREVLLDKISRKIDINWFENKRGNIEVQVGNGHFLVHDLEANALIPRKTAGDVGFSNINIMTSGQKYDITDTVKGGSLKERIDLRDGVLKQYKENIDHMAKELSFEVNRIHASGTGIFNAKANETSSFGLNEEARSQPLPYLETGKFEIKLIDEDNEITETLTVELEAGKETLESIVKKINIAAGGKYLEGENGKEALNTDESGLKAQMNKDGSVSLTAMRGNRFIFGEDNTNVLPVLGFNTFFQTIEGAEDLRVNKLLIEDEMGISSGYDLIPGDNRVALEIAALQFNPTMEEDSLTFNEYYNSQVIDVGLRMERAQKGEANHKQTLDHFIKLRDSISSVNVDEEMANMIKYQRAYEASAKFISTIDEMTQTLVNM